MASQEKPYSSDFKAKVALEALAQKKQHLDRLSEKYDVPVSLILTWTVQLERNAYNIYTETPEPTDIPMEASEKEEYVDVDIEDKDISASILSGAMADNLDLKKLTFWSVLGIIFVIVFVQGLKEMYDITVNVNEEKLAAQTEFHDVTEQKKESEEELSSFGVVDIQKGVYYIPIDTVINEMAVDSK